MGLNTALRALGTGVKNASGGGAVGRAARIMKLLAKNKTLRVVSTMTLGVGLIRKISSRPNDKRNSNIPKIYK